MNLKVFFPRICNLTLPLQLDTKEYVKTDWVKNQTKKNRLGSFNEDVLFQEGGRV